MGIRLAHGVLVFAYATEIERLRRDTNVNGKSYFVVQDPKRLNYGGLLAPGEYSSLDMSWDLTLAVVVPNTPRPGSRTLSGGGPPKRRSAASCQTTTQRQPESDSP